MDTSKLMQEKPKWFPSEHFQRPPISYLCCRHHFR